LERKLRKKIRKRAAANGIRLLLQHRLLRKQSQRKRVHQLKYQKLLLVLLQKNRRWRSQL
jgi:hypothetical protein